jgi:hypothetical protein
MRVMEREAKIKHVTSIAYRLAKQGVRPDLAWIGALARCTHQTR